jgi:hypothetical protein
MGLILLGVIVGSGSLKGLGRHIGRNYRGLVPHHYLEIHTPAYLEAKTALLQRGLDLDSGRVAMRIAEEFTYVTGLRTISLPGNCQTVDDNFRAWLVAFKPDYILAEEEWLTQMQLQSWAVGKTGAGQFTILKVPTDQIRAD